MFSLTGYLPILIFIQSDRNLSKYASSFLRTSEFLQPRPKTRFFAKTMNVWLMGDDWSIIDRASFLRFRWYFIWSYDDTWFKNQYQLISIRQLYVRISPYIQLRRIHGAVYSCAVYTVAVYMARRGMRHDDDDSCGRTGRSRSIFTKHSVVWSGPYRIRHTIVYR